MSGLVPVVDLGAGDAAAQLDRAATEVGFLQVVGHGVDPALPGRVLELIGEFFALPQGVKDRYASPSPDVNNGYSAIGAESLAYSLGVEAPPDLFEAFNFGPEDLDLSDPAVLAERDRIFAPNIWPAEVPELAVAVPAYLHAVRVLYDRVAELAATALGLPTGFFADFGRHPTETLRCNWYERAAGSPNPLPGQQRMGAHTDYGILTLLWADPVPGLQVLAKHGEWVDVIPDPGAYVINIGDLLAQWTNDRWVSTLHRVVPPPSNVEGPSRRRSIAYFFDGDWDAIVECLPTCCSDDQPAKYAPVRALDHLMNKLVGGRAMEPAASTAHLGDRAVT